jgi:hypothetical protein
VMRCDMVVITNSICIVQCIDIYSVDCAWEFLHSVQAVYRAVTAQCTLHWTDPRCPSSKLLPKDILVYIFNLTVGHPNNTVYYRYPTENTYKFIYFQTDSTVSCIDKTGQKATIAGLRCRCAAAEIWKEMSIC